MPQRNREVISNIQPGRDWFGNMIFFLKIFIRLNKTFIHIQGDPFKMSQTSDVAPGKRRV